MKKVPIGRQQRIEGGRVSGGLGLHPLIDSYIKREAERHNVTARLVVSQMVRYVLDVPVDADPRYSVGHRLLKRRAG